MKTINIIIEYGFYLGIIIMIILGIKICIDVIKKRWIALFNDIKVVINLGITFIFCWGLFLSFALIVLPPIKRAATYEESIDKLDDWTIDKLLTQGAFGIGLIIFIALITYLVQVRFESNKSTRLILGLLIVNIGIIISTMFVTYYHTLYSLSIEVGYNFR